MLCLDIETYHDQLPDNYLQYKIGDIKAPANYKDQDKIDAYVANAKIEALDKLALSPLTGRIILIGMLFDKNPELANATEYAINMKPVWYVPLQGEEEEILEKFWMLSSKHLFQDANLLSFNGKAFDLPFIMNRSAIKKVKPPRKMQMTDYLSKYRHTPHFDLFNWFGSGSLVEWSYRLGISDSLQRDGHKIGTWYETGQMQLIIDKNIIDVAQTTTIYQAIKDML